MPPAATTLVVGIPVVRLGNTGVNVNNMIWFVPLSKLRVSPTT